MTNPEQIAAWIEETEAPDPDALALDNLAAWFHENTDPDGQWGSASDFIEYAALIITGAGRDLDPPACPECGTR